jgi:hypothetical protein
MARLRRALALGVAAGLLVSAGTTPSRAASPIALLQLPQGAGPASVSGDGRYVVYTTGERIGALTHSVTYVFDRKTGRSDLVSVSSTGQKAGPGTGNTGCGGRSGSISADGRYVAFCSWAGNLVPHDTNEMPDVFVRDRVTRTTTRINLDSHGRQLSRPYGESKGWLPTWDYNVAMSRDGSHVLLRTGQDLLGDGATMATYYVYDRRARRFTSVDRVPGTVRPAATETPTATGVWGGTAGMSANGRYVVFSTTTKLVAADTDDQSDVYLRDTGRGTTTLVSDPASVGGFEAAPSTATVDPDITYYDQATIDATGRYIAFYGLDIRTGVTEVDPGARSLSARILVEDVTTRRAVEVTSHSVLEVRGTAGFDTLFASPMIADDGKSVLYVVPARSTSDVPEAGTYPVDAPVLYRIAAAGGTPVAITAPRYLACAEFCVPSQPAPTAENPAATYSADISFVVASHGAAQVFFVTTMQMVPEDTDNIDDSYVWHG